MSKITATKPFLRFRPAGFSILHRTSHSFNQSRNLIAATLQMQMRSQFGGQLRFYSAGGSPTREDIEARIIQILKDFDKVDPEKVTSESRFVNDLGLDSLDTVEVVMAIEEEFVIEIPDKDADSILSVNDAIEYISKRDDAQ
ncbi:hypothetical protein G9A89_010317 [Geosiphon pyriformis]|nr:hypothetical protein G9A89_010317 [Geosiphon pyriformis]